MLKGRTLDQRLKATFMLPGANYPEITQTSNGITQKLFSLIRVMQIVILPALKNMLWEKPIDCRNAAQPQLILIIPI